MAYRLEEEGHDVRVYLENRSKMYDNILPKADDLLELNIQPDDYVIFDMVGGGDGAEALKEKGYTVIGAGKLNDSLELDRNFGLDFMKEHGIKIPPTYNFSSISEVREFLADKEERYVIKPSGNADTSLTYVSTSAENLRRMLDYMDDKIEEGTEIVLQEFVEGIEMSTEAWFNGERFLQPINSTMEDKKFLAGDYGPNTGCMGNVVWIWPDDISEYLYRTIFEPLEPKLQEAGYLGPLDLNAIWTDEGPYGLEWTARFGYDAIQAMAMLLDEPLGSLLTQLPTLPQFPVQSTKTAFSVRVSIPPFPNDDEVPELPLMGFNPKKKAHYFLSDVYYDEDEKILKCAGTDGYVVCVADARSSVAAARRRVYDLVDTLEIPSMQLRRDVGARYDNDRDVVEAWIASLLA